jgi:hypothetical protein
MKDNISIATNEREREKAGGGGGRAVEWKPSGECKHEIGMEAINTGY